MIELLIDIIRTPFTELLMADYYYEVPKIRSIDWKTIEERSK